MTEPALHVLLKQQTPIPLDVEFTCGSEELLVLIGPSGCGKSTILRSIAGLYSPKLGHIYCCGEDWYSVENRINIPTYKRHVGMVFQNYALFPHMTVQENIILSMHGMSDAAKRKKALCLLSSMKLDGLHDRMPRQLSGGQRQRTAVARALAREPKVLLLDEPFSAVDKVVRQQLYNELQELQQLYAIPIVLVTHDFEEARLLGNKVVVLDGGRNLQNGSPVHVFNRPHSVSVARLLGVKNLFTAKVIQHEPEEGLTILNWGGTRIVAPMHDAFSPGGNVVWHVPPGEITVHPLGCDFFQSLRNPLRGTVVRATVFPPVTRMTMCVDDNPEKTLFVDAAHPALRNERPGPGVSFSLSIPFESVHLMQYEEIKL